MRSKYLYIKDIIGEAVARTAVAMQDNAAYVEATGGKSINYVYGGQTHIIQQLRSIKDGTKYPMVALMLGTGIKRGNSDGYFGVTAIKAIYIATLGDNKTLPATKYATNFEPILEPIYTELMEQLAQHRSIVETDSDNIPHEVWEHPADNTDQPNTIFTDFLDIMGIYNLSFTLSAQPVRNYARGI
jgi:hypothetical protein